MARAISMSLAPVIEQLELDGDLVVSINRLAEVLGEVGIDEEPRQLGYELQRAGWFGSLRTNGAWEFYPGSRGGKYGSGDRFIEFRAQHAVDPAWPGVLAMESAASVLGLAQRIPEREVVALPPSVAPPKAFAGEWRTVGLALPDIALSVVDQLPTWGLEGLVAGIAARPSAYRDMPGLGQWLPEVANKANFETVYKLLEQLSPAARQRTAYLLDMGGNHDASAAVLARFPPQNVAWLGKRKAGGYFHSATQVNDTALHHFLTVGMGS